MTEQILNTPEGVRRHAVFMTGLGVLHLESQGVTVTREMRENFFNRAYQDLVRERRLHEGQK